MLVRGLQDGMSLLGGQVLVVLLQLLQYQAHLIMKPRVYQRAHKTMQPTNKLDASHVFAR